MTEGQEEARPGMNMYCAEENPYSTDLFERPDLFYGNPDDNLNVSTEQYPNNMYFDESAGFNEYSGWEGELGGANAAEIRGMVSCHFLSNCKKYFVSATLYLYEL